MSSWSAHSTVPIVGNPRSTGISSKRTLVGKYMVPESYGTKIEGDGDATFSGIICTNLQVTSEAQVNNLTVTGVLKTTGAVEVGCDYKMKEKFVDLVDATSTIMSLKPIKYYHRLMKENTTGFIAQQVQAILPEAVHSRQTYNEHGDLKEFKTVSLMPILAYITKALKEVVERLDKVEKVLVNKWETENGLNNMFSSQMKFNMRKKSE